MNPEQLRLQENHAADRPWHRWGPYVSEREWGTVREDYSADGNAWDYFSHDQARSRAYRWGEDGIGGFGDRHGVIALTVGLWNGNDPILKERLFGLTNSQGNHGEDVKECYWYLDCTPTHSYQRMLYRYPHCAFPYQDLIQRNHEAGRASPEVELFDLGVFNEDRFFDVEIEYGKVQSDHMVARITATNCGPEAATIWVLPQMTFRNRWTWEPEKPHPIISKMSEEELNVGHPHYGDLRARYSKPDQFLFTENETNFTRLYGAPDLGAFTKDGFHRAIIEKHDSAVNPGMQGSKAAAVYTWTLQPNESRSMTYQLGPPTEPAANVDNVLALRRTESDQFYAELAPSIPAEMASIQRQALAGLLWSKQFFHYNVHTWLDGDATQPTPPGSRTRNQTWRNVHCAEVISMPDKWEYPWFAAWDLAFHMVPMVLVDPDFAKDQLLLLLREWYQHPNGQIPAYEWNFSDVNPPVHAWAAMRVFRIDRKATGTGDIEFLKRVFNKLLLNFTWWVNRKDTEGNNVFEGGFLGLDNIGVFDRNRALPDNYRLEQSDGTSWMAMFCLNMLDMALEIAQMDAAYEDVASKFFEHFMYIATAMNSHVEDGAELWDETDGFYYDVLSHGDGTVERNRVRSMVGLIPLLAVTTLDEEVLNRFPGFRRRMQWFLKNRPDLTKHVACMQTKGMENRHLLSVVDPERMRRILGRMLDTEEFLSPYGLRSLSKVHEHFPFSLTLNGENFKIDYEPGESTTGAFGGNSNWRGPIWMPLNYLLIEAIQKFDYYCGPEFQVDLPTRSGELHTLAEVAGELETRLLSIFVPEDGKRPVNGNREFLNENPRWRDMIWFFEYFHAETGTGLGASHQTGWTAVIAKIIQQLYVTMKDV